jgi:hypothetical protein
MTESASVGELRPPKLKTSCTTKDLFHWICRTAFEGPLCLCRKLDWARIFPPDNRAQGPSHRCPTVGRPPSLLISTHFATGCHLRLLANHFRK